MTRQDGKIPLGFARRNFRLWPRVSRTVVRLTRPSKLSKAKLGSCGLDRKNPYPLTPFANRGFWSVTASKCLARPSQSRHSRAGRGKRRRVLFFGNPFCSRPRTSEPLGGARGVLVPGGHRPGPTEAGAETGAPPRRGVARGRSSPVESVLRRPNRQVRPSPCGGIQRGDGRQWRPSIADRGGSRDPASLFEGAALRWRAFCADRAGRRDGVIAKR